MNLSEGDNDREIRLAELRSKKTLSNAEMQEFQRLDPDSFTTVPGSVGMINVADAIANLSQFPKRIADALQASHFLEVISLVLLRIDFILRIYIVTKSGKSIESTDRKSLGQRIVDAKKLGLSPEITSQLTQFNQDRIAAEHHLYMGSMTYQQLEPVAIQGTNLASRLMTHMISEIQNTRRTN